MIETFLKQKYGWLSAAAFIGVPTALWFTTVPQFGGDAASVLFSVGQYLGVLGLSLFTLALIISIRVPQLEVIFGDLATAYRFHQWAGTLATVVCLLHPLLLTIPLWSVSLSSVLGFVISWHDPFQFFGLLALIVLVGAMICTFFLHLPYHIWKKTHRYLAVAFLLGALHGIFVQGAIQQSPALRLVFALFLLAGVVTVVYRILMNRILVKRAPYRIASVEPIGLVTRLKLEPMGKPITFRAGQFAYLLIHDPRMADEHPFSICAPEGSSHLTFMAKQLGDDTKRFPALVPGTKVDVEGPYGTFSFRNGGTRQLWIGGGIGITPFLSMATSLPAGYNVIAYYSVKVADEAVAREEFEAVAAKHGSFHPRVWVTNDQGYLTIAALQKTGLDLKAIDDVFLCGPPPMVEALRDELVKCGVLPARIHAERFATRVLFAKRVAPRLATTVPKKA